MGKAVRYGKARSSDDSLQDTVQTLSVINPICPITNYKWQIACLKCRLFDNGDALRIAWV
jgi:hypothetical protein